MRSSSTLGVFVSLVLLACGGDSSDPAPENVPPAATAPSGSESSEAPASAKPPSQIGIAAPTAFVVRAGGSMTFEVKLTRPADAVGPTSFEILDVPQGVAAQSTTDAKDVVTVTLDATAEAALGDHPLRLRASAGGIGGEVRAPLVVAGAPGTLDTTFGVAGIGAKLTDDFGHSLVLDRQGRALVTGGRLAAQKYESTMTRFLPNGSVDTSFGAGGTLKERFTGGSMSMAHTSVLLDDGSIVVAGAILMANNEPKTCFVKLDAAGKHIPAFGTAGQVCAPTSVSMPLHAAVVGPDGSIYAVGYAMTVDKDMSVMKVTKDGAIDATFGIAGRVTFASAGDQEPVGIAIDSAGRIVVGGRDLVDQKACAWRLDASGNIDTTYGGGLAKGTTGMLGMEAYGMALGPSDEVYLVGKTTGSQMAVVAFDAKGSMLSSFGSSGWITFALSKSESLFGAVWDDGKLLLTGIGQAANAAEKQSLALRVGKDGQLDPTFTKNGFALYPTAGDAVSIGLSPGRATILTMRDGMQLMRVWR